MTIDITYYPPRHIVLLLGAMSGVYPTVCTDFHESCISSIPYLPLPLHSTNPHSFFLTSSLLTSAPTASILLVSPPFPYLTRKEPS
jgi:hypothetical protein